jgi:protein transport protein SEC61 subunit gamma-like protein
MGYIDQATEEVVSFVDDTRRFFEKCEKPQPTELKRIAVATGFGLLVMGFIGFAVKLVHIPINSSMFLFVSLHSLYV